mmetsp:Transcript_16237/g.53196  ORF Transcript_16237/g.53196 Transcript_16237/m.53196 type:complete len:242 (-) Transcript_16237:1837-2562(-)
MATRHTASAPAAPEGSTALTPVTSTATRPRSCAAGARCSGAAGSGVAPSDRYAASCRALGWSKTSVLGSAARPPTAACSWLRSSTAPSESTPASSRGVSASAVAPAVRCTSSSTSATLRLRVAAATAPAASARLDAFAPAPPGRPNALSKAGVARPARKRSHRTATAASTGGASRDSAAASAGPPSAMPSSPIPDACSLVRTLSAAAMPEDAQGPHCTLRAARPRACTPRASASRPLLAAL